MFDQLQHILLCSVRDINSICMTCGCVNTGAFVLGKHSWMIKKVPYTISVFKLFFFGFWLEHFQTNKVAADLEESVVKDVSGGKMQFP